jgi:type II secretory pathway pseudopilin PulG
MKLTQKTNNKAIKSGMTLLELTVVILVLLSLIAILFIGARAWKKGSDRAGCIMNIRNVQQAVRGHQNMTNSNSTTPAESAIYGANGYMSTPSCPAGGTYTYGPAPIMQQTGVDANGNPVMTQQVDPVTGLGMTAGPGAAGTLFLACTLATTDDHVPTDAGSW